MSKIMKILVVSIAVLISGMMYQTHNENIHEKCEWNASGWESNDQKNEENTCYPTNTADLSSDTVVAKAREMMVYHPLFKQMTPVLGKRVLLTFCEQLDPLKLYLTFPEVQSFVEPSPDMIERVEKSFRYGNFELFENMIVVMQRAIFRNRNMNEQIEKEKVEHPVSITWKELPWVENEQALYDRLKMVYAFQVQAFSQLDQKLFSTAIQRVRKRKMLFERTRLENDPILFKKITSTFIMKAFAEALDSESAFFTPVEAKQLLINMQQRLFGVGVLLKDDIDGFSVAKIVDGGPANVQGELALGDKIIAIDEEPVIGMDLVDVVERIRGQAGSTISLKIMRRAGKDTITKDIVLKRGEVVVQDLRCGVTLERCQEGVIACIRLHSFYQDERTSSYNDLLSILEKVQQEYLTKGVILDLRCNPGGLLSQAIAVSGLFIDKGVVVSIYDERKKLCHMRNTTQKKAWDGPLVILINRASASASEVVAQALQDWGRAIIVGDDRSFGKGSFQLFTLSPDGSSIPNPQGEFKVTKGRYYTVSGKSPQLVGVASDIVVPSIFAFSEIGEQYLRFPLPADSIGPHFEDVFEDVPLFHRKLLQRLYDSAKEVRSDKWRRFLPEIKKKARERLSNNEAFQKFLRAAAEKKMAQYGNDSASTVDFQLEEAWNVIKDLIAAEKAVIEKSISKKYRLTLKAASFQEDKVVVGRAA